MKNFIFYMVAGTVIAGFSELAGADFAVTFFASLLIPPFITLVLSLMRLRRTGP